MKNPLKVLRIPILLLASLMLFSCGLDFSRKASKKVKKALRSNGGNWEVSEFQTYYIGNDRYNPVKEVDKGIIGTFHFSKNDSDDIASSAEGTWTPTNQATQEMRYQLFTDDNDDETVTVVIYEYSNGNLGPNKSYEVDLDYSKHNQNWNDVSSVGISDSVIIHRYTLRNLGS